jgi:hypothetical protein
MVWFLVRFPDSIALELVTVAHQGSDRATGFRKENGTAKLGILPCLASKIDEKTMENSSPERSHRNLNKIGAFLWQSNHCR